MSATPLSEESIKALIQSVLDAVNVSESVWNDLRGTLLRSTPVWPGVGAQFSSAAELAPFIDHTLLKPDATRADIERLCDEAAKYEFASVCVNSGYVDECVALLKETEVVVCGVAGFPLGAMATELKRAEAEFIVDHGGGEVDMVVNIGALKSTDAAGVANDIKSVVDAAWGCPVKVILETGLLDAEDIIAGCVLSVVSGAAFVKTSTGFGHGGATADAVHLMRLVVGPHIGVKASGGIRDAATAVRMIKAGANRLGSSSGIAIVSGAVSQ